MTSVLVAYTIIFAAFFIYTWLIGSRQKDLERKVDELKDLLKDSSRR